MSHTLARRLKVTGLRYTSAVREKVYRITQTPFIPVVHYNIRNWGDRLGPMLAQRLSDQRVLSLDIDSLAASPALRDHFSTTLLSVGSILHHADRRSIVWGSGLQSQGVLPREKPAGVVAVRGPLTARALSAAGMGTCHVFGDPAILLPTLLRRPPQSNAVQPNNPGRLGIIPHISDVDSPHLDRLSRSNNVRIIDIRQSILGFLNDLWQCDYIASSSLHGLIAADAYGIPSSWVEFGDRIPGGHFKFRDYYESLGVAPHGPQLVSNASTAPDLCQTARKHDTSGLTAGIEEAFHVAMSLGKWTAHVDA